VDYALFLSALMLGLAGAPHCAAMCGAACTAVVRRGQGGTQAAFHVARVASYAAVGALAASSVGLLSSLGQWSPALRPLWTLAHVAAFGLGLWLLWRGRQPAWLQRLGHGTRQASPQHAGGWQRMRGPVGAAAAGGLWAAWPCGLLQSALVVAALANTPLGGAAVMAGFAAVSASGLAFGPWLWARFGGGALAGQAVVWATRGAGALLAVASGWALGHGLWQQWLAYCAT
jgi:sulfite exporter TauE/SafE